MKPIVRALVFMHDIEIDAVVDEDDDDVCEADNAIGDKYCVSVGHAIGHKYCAYCGACC